MANVGFGSSTVALRNDARGSQSPDRSTRINAAEESASFCIAIAVDKSGRLRSGARRCEESALTWPNSVSGSMIDHRFTYFVFFAGVMAIGAMLAYQLLRTSIF
jgi:hypothetical protein